MAQLNEVRLPGISEVALQKNKEIFAHFTGAELLEGITIAFAGAGALEAGQVMARVVASGKYVAYDEGVAVGGDNVPHCILRTGVTVDAAGDALGEGVFGQATLKADQCVDLDTDAVTSLGGRLDTVRNMFTF